ncbi:MAG: Transcriptional regulator, TrmB [Parcubacteria group bacterium GW2011_GWA2_44_12]|nr:MAG: Transcriptional regulator, TrmB [Parcubacteria group bacterium GW2011_GWA2_44_12]
MQKNDDPIKISLEKLGFSEKEASLYIALLELGKGTVSRISRKANIKRTTGYVILDALLQKGLASISGKKPKQEYSAEPPGKILELAREKVKKDQADLACAEQLVPELIAMHAKSDRPKVSFYEGTEGLIQVYEDTLTSHEPIRAYATFDDMHKALPNYFPAYYKRRGEKGIHIRGIVPLTPSALEREKHNTEETRQMAFIPSNKFYFSPEIDIYDNKIMIASWREKLGIIIESGEIADAMKKIYELAWAEAKRLDAKIKKEM